MLRTGGPAYPEDIAERAELATKTVKNALTGLRKQGVVEATGKVDGRTEQVQISVPASQPPKRDGDGDAKHSNPDDLCAGQQMDIDATLDDGDVGWF
ncbi:MAG: hypothetical protein H0V53_14750 [Rubrobacter sp.]|jgi:hypothetical protein|nr:hypothetical protein [Rubrobacter sp.]